MSNTDLHAYFSDYEITIMSTEHVKTELKPYYDFTPKYQVALISPFTLQFK